MNYNMIVKVLKALAKDWWKYALILAVIGFGLSRVTCKTPWAEFDKGQPKIFDKGAKK